MPYPPLLEAMHIISCGRAEISGYDVVFLYEKDSIIIIAYKDGFWRSVVDSIKFDEICDLVKQSRDQYVKNLSEAFSSSERSTYFTLTDDGLNLKFVWSKEIKKGVKVVLGSFCLEPSLDAKKSLGELTRSLVTGLTGLIRRLADTERENQNLRALAQNSMKKYEETVSQMEDKETVLLSKFSAVLNEKKKKIGSFGQYPCSIPSDSENAPGKSVTSLSMQGEDQDDLLPSKDRKKSSNMLIRSHQK